jgi:hypothetical protein
VRCGTTRGATGARLTSIVLSDSVRGPVATLNARPLNTNAWRPADSATTVAQRRRADRDADAEAAMPSLPIHSQAAKRDRLVAEALRWDEKRTIHRAKESGTKIPLSC